jgi:hypothetical protein
VLGVSTYPTGPHTWWRPDGSPLAEAPCDSPSNEGGFEWELDERYVLRVIAARVSIPFTDPDADDLLWTLSVDLATNIRGELGATKGGKDLPGIWTVVFPVRKGVETCSAGPWPSFAPWETVATSDGKRLVRGSLHSRYYYVIGPAYAGKNGAIIAVSDNIETGTVRIVARDHAGRERRQRTGSIARNKEFRQTTAEFPLDPDQVQEFRLQVQPLVDAAVKGIALRRNGGK